MRIALFDYRVVPTNPVGSCHWRLLSGLAQEHDFTVFAVEFENPNPERIRWVRIPAPIRPYVLLYIVFHVLAPIYYLLHRWRTGVRFDVVQFVESNLTFGNVAYAHFCHRAYLRDHWQATGARGLRGAFRFAAHKMAAIMEPRTYKSARRVIVPSQGLSRELREQYAEAGTKTTILPNPVDVDRMRMPADFEREAARRKLGFGPDDIVIAFLALGHFERKGLPILLDALEAAGDSPFRLLVVGGAADTVAVWQAEVTRRNLKNSVRFTGMQRDVRPFLWASDAFALPSHYEVFPLVALEAAAAGLPLLVTPLNGVEEFLVPDRNGLLVNRTSESIREGLNRIRAMQRTALLEMGAQAQRDVQRYATTHFVDRWRDFYRTCYVVD